MQSQNFIFMYNPFKISEASIVRIFFVLYSINVIQRVGGVLSTPDICSYFYCLEGLPNGYLESLEDTLFTLKNLHREPHTKAVFRFR